MRIYDIIHKKRMGEALTREEIDFFVSGYTSGEIHDYQASALCMAICCNGANWEESLWLTQAMLDSGDRVDLSALGTLSVDKHSTGGVGDKTTLIVAPIAASLGCKVAKMSGRGLGHTGGTVDKLESVDGFRVSLSSSEFFDIVDRVGVCVVGQSGSLVPADKKLYALRDVTATVDSIPLIASSIMSKKLASGAHSIVLDVKCGSGAFMKKFEDAKALCDYMVKIGESSGRRMSALITDMDVPLGYAVGNRLEVMEAARLLRGEMRGALLDVCVALASRMVSSAREISLDDAERMVLDCIMSGKAYNRFCEWLTAQGVSPDTVARIDELPLSAHKLELRSERDGYVAAIDALAVGECACMLGAGRVAKDDAIDYGAGVLLSVGIGDFVKRGDVLATLYTSVPSALAPCAEKLGNAMEYSDNVPPTRKIILSKQ